MNRLDEAKSVDIVSFLSSVGFTGKPKGNKVWFCSPIRGGETKPSFVVFTDTNRWIDFGGNKDKTSDIIDLVCVMYNVPISEAITKLLGSEELDQFEQKKYVKENDSTLIVNSVHDHFIDPRLIYYLKERKIPESIYSVNTKEVHYSFVNTPDKKYTAVGWVNDSGGYELRNARHKYASTPKDITFIENGGHTLHLFEGFIDYLSALAYFGVDKLEGDTMVLNGLWMVYRVLERLKCYEKINSYLDNGDAAEQATTLIKSFVGVDKFFDHRYMFCGEDDFNDFLKKVRS